MFWTFLSRNLAILTIVGAVTAYLYPPLFLLFKDYFLWCFAATMFAIGVVLHPEEAKSALSRPLQIGLGVMTQYTSCHSWVCGSNDCCRSGDVAGHCSGLCDCGLCAGK